MKKSGRCRLAVQHGAWAYFGQVELEVEVSPAGEEVLIDVPADVTRWRAGIAFGLSYALEKWRRTRRSTGAVSIRVIRAQGHAVDTTEVVMAFVTAHALWDALGEHPAALPTLNPSDGTFTFPK